LTIQYEQGAPLSQLSADVESNASKPHLSIKFPTDAMLAQALPPIEEAMLEEAAANGADASECTGKSD
jgi:hypothetical protein